MQPTHHFPHTRRWLVAAGCALVVPVALVAGYGFGSRLNGMLLGVATAANTAVMAALLVDFAVDVWLDRVQPGLQSWLRRGLGLRQHG